MRKTPTVFNRDFEGNPSRVLNTPHPDCLWVLASEGTATRKYDGTCTMFDGITWWKRREIKPGAALPPGFTLAAEDPVTGKSVGWMPVEPTDKWHLEGIASVTDPKPGTYELIGPKVQGNPEKAEAHTMVAHAKAEQFEDCPRDFEGLRDFLESLVGEGIVFHHPDGRMAKIKRRDFGFK